MHRDFKQGAREKNIKNFMWLLNNYLDVFVLITKIFINEIY